MNGERLENTQNDRNVLGADAFEHLSSLMVLLQTWARLYDRFDGWPDACEQWASHGPSSKILQQAQPLLDKVFLYTNEKEDSVYSNIRRNRRLFAESMAKSIFVDEEGKILLIGESAEHLVGVRKNQYIQPALIDPFETLLRAAEAEPNSFRLIEIVGNDGIQRLCGVKKFGDERCDNARLVFTLHAIILPEAAERYLRESLGLTDAEVDIVRRSLRREDLETIAKSRANTLNTIRTHISKLTKKFGCRNFTDVITRTHELIAYQETYQSFSRDLAPAEAPAARRITSMVKLSAKDSELEYARYGPESDRPLVLLHSLEYGFVPTPQFVEAALSRGYVVYAPLRPGFGRSTPADSLRECAEALHQFMERLRLRNATVVALSTSAPAALQLCDISDRVSECVLVNYALDAKDKLADVKPSWLRGLLDLLLKSKHSFKFSARMTGRMYRSFGFERFYRQLYKGCQEDLGFLERHPANLEAAGDLLFSANEESVRLDLLSSFDPDFPIDWGGERKTPTICVHGQNTHGVSNAPAQEAAERLGIPYREIGGSGRNCVFQEPEAFFDAIGERHLGLKTA